MLSISNIANEVVAALGRLYELGNIQEFVATIGYDLEPVVDQLDNVQNTTDSLIDSLSDLEEAAQIINILTEDGDSDSHVVIENLYRIFDSIHRVYEGIGSIGDAFNSPELVAHVSIMTGGGSIEEFTKQFIERTTGWIIVDYLEEVHPTILSFFRAIGVIESIDQEDNPDQYQTTFTEHRIHWDRINGFITNPDETIATIYRWGSDEPEVELLFDDLTDMFLAYGLAAGTSYATDEEIAKFDMLVPGNFVADSPDPVSLSIVIWDEPETQSSLRFQLTVLPSTDSVPSGVGLSMTASTEGRDEIALSESVLLTLDGGGALDAGLLAVFIPGQQPVFHFDFPAQSINNLGIRLTKSHEFEDAGIVLGKLDSSRLEIGGVGSIAGLELVADEMSNIYGEIELNDGRVFIGTSEGDNFIRMILPDLNVDAQFDLVLGWSTVSGLYLRGSGGIEIVIPIHKSIGPIKIESIYLAVPISEDVAIQIRVAVTAAVQIGPISASIDRIGIQFSLNYPDGGGNMGPLQFDPAFLPPLGAGLAIDAGAIAGGGYVEFDDPNKRYAGILQLQAGGIGLVAIGLITTRMPDGSEGFSLLINIGVEFMPPIQLPYGFTLSGVGGLLGYNRTMKTDVLRDGLRNRTLDSILFPENPIANAPKIISDLRAVFPPEEGRFVIGPMVKLGWGTPVNIIQAVIGIFIELPMPIRIALLGQIAAGLPVPDKAIIELHIDILGIIEFDKQLLSIDATIYDSRIYEYTLTGDAALRLSWGDNPVFATSLGGFHPRFSPPPNFPSLRRLTLNLSQGPDVQLYCKTYKALTSQSLQFGATVDLYAKQSGATIEGDLAFDTLIYFDPFSFVVAMSGNVVARYKGHELASVYLSLRLLGPTPWVASGKASFEILFWDVEVEFHKTWGPVTAITAEAVDPWPKLHEALISNNSWGSQLPGRNGMVEVLADMEDVGDPAPLVLHPAGFLQISQKVVPFGIRLDKFGNAPVKDHNFFEIERITIGSEELELNAVEEDFARGQFVTLADPLSAPSFEKMDAGVAASSDRLSFETPVATELTYESILIQEDRTSKQADYKDEATLDWRVAKRQLACNAACRSGLRATGRRKFETLGQAKQVGLVNDGYTLASNEDMSALDLAGNDGSLGQLQAEQLLSEYLNTNPELANTIAVVPNYEVAA